MAIKCVGLQKQPSNKRRFKVYTSNNLMLLPIKTRDIEKSTMSSETTKMPAYSSGHTCLTIKPSSKAVPIKLLMLYWLIQAFLHCLPISYISATLKRNNR